MSLTSSQAEEKQAAKPFRARFLKGICVSNFLSF